MRTFSTLLLALAVILGALLSAAGGFAQATAPGKAYVGIGVGPIVPQSVAANLNGAAVGSGTLQFNASGFVGLVIGYRLAEHFGAEAEGGWSLYDSHDLVGTFSRSGNPLPGDIPLNGDMHTWLGLVNFLYRPRYPAARLTPYIGAGVGAAGLEWLVDSRPGGSTILSLRGGRVSAAVNAIAGLDYFLTRQFSLGSRYNFVHVVSAAPTISGGGITLAHGTPEIHLLQMVASYHFWISFLDASRASACLTPPCA